MSSILSVRSLNRNFGGLRAIHDLSFELQRGAITSIVGPNGAGKSTLFNMFTGYLRPTSGQILFNNKSIVGLPPHLICGRGIARAFQIAKPFPQLSVEKNIWVAAEFGASGYRDPAAVVEHAIETCRLLPWRHAEASSLSVGTLRRLELACAMAARPTLLLADEPCAGLNETETREVTDVLLEIKAAGVTVLLVEHDMKAVRRISGRVIVIEAGRKIADGPPSDVLSNQVVIDAYLGSAA